MGHMLFCKLGITSTISSLFCIMRAPAVERLGGGTFLHNPLILQTYKLSSPNTIQVATTTSTFITTPTLAAHDGILESSPRAQRHPCHQFHTAHSRLSPFSRDGPPHRCKFLMIIETSTSKLIIAFTISSLQAGHLHRISQQISLLTIINSTTPSNLASAFTFPPLVYLHSFSELIEGAAVRHSQLAMVQLQIVLGGNRI